MTNSTLDNAFIQDLVSDNTYTLQFLPDTITDNKGSGWGLYNIQGRSAPLRGYNTGPPRRIAFTVRMFAQPNQDDDSPTPADIKQYIDMLLALPYPDYSAGIAPPHKCLVSIGNNILMTGVCVNAEAEYRRGDPWELGPGNTYGVYVRLEFEETNDTPLDYYDRLGGAG